MKQKMVIRLSLQDERSRSKAMRTAVGVDGVESASLLLDKDQIEVTGNDVDVVLLTTRLRKRVKCANPRVVSVSPVKEEGEKKEEKEEEKKEEPKVEQIIVGCPQTYPCQCPPAPYICTYQCYEPSPSCSIL